MVGPILEDISNEMSEQVIIAKLDIDKDVLSETSNLQLLSTLAMLAPFNKIDKQAILESPNIASRINTINSILDLNTFQVVSNKEPNQLN